MPNEWDTTQLQEKDKIMQFSTWKIMQFGWILCRLKSAEREEQI